MEHKRDSHHPLTREEIESLSPVKATEVNPHLRKSHVTQTSYVNVPAGATFTPKVKTERIDTGADGQSLWKVETEVEQGVSGVPLGRTIQRHERSLAVKRTVSSHPSYRPPWIGASFIPNTGSRIVLPKLRGREGREYNPLTVFPGDSRQILFDTSWPWLLTGKITNSDGMTGSGVLIGDRLVLTARHVLPWNSINAGSWWMKFTPHSFDGNEPFGSSFASDATHYGTDDTDFNLSHDYAVLRLFDPLGSQLGYLGSTTFDDNWRGLNVWSNIGYAIDIANAQRPSVQNFQSMEDDYEDDDGQTLETEASLNHGDSGGPFFAWFDNGNQVRVVGVVSGEAGFGDDADNALSGGDNLVNLIDWARSNWPL